MPRDGKAQRKEHREGMKHCNRCKEWKPLSEFFVDHSRWDGLNSHCKECGRAMQREYPVGAGHVVAAMGRRTPYNEDGHKLCTNCRQWKPLGKFGPKTDSWDGKRSICRDCSNKRKRDKYVRMGRPAKRGPYEMTLEGRKAIAASARARMTGASNPNWKGGETVPSWRAAPEYRQWRRDVFVRDHFTCQECGDNSGGDLTAHHVQSAEDYPGLRFDVANGITLCESCHSKVHGIPVKGSRHKETEMTVCACGCETPMKRWASAKSTRPRRYLPGHFIHVLLERQVAKKEEDEREAK